MNTPGISLKISYYGWLTTGTGVKSELTTTFKLTNLNVHVVTLQLVFSS